MTKPMIEPQKNPCSVRHPVALVAAHSLPLSTRSFAVDQMSVGAGK